MTYLAAYTGPTPETGYVGYVNLSLRDGAVVFTVRSEGLHADQMGCYAVPLDEARKLLYGALLAIEHRKDGHD